MTSKDEVQWSGTTAREFSIVSDGASPFETKVLAHAAATSNMQPRSKGRFQWSRKESWTETRSGDHRAGSAFRREPLTPKKGQRLIERILADKRAEVAALNATMIRSVRPSTRDLAYAVGAGREAMSLLVEVKRRDPFEGDVRPDLDLAGFAAQLQDSGIGALVVATESRHWGGSSNDLVALDGVVQMPLLRHDFIVEELQLFESRRAGADAVFLRPSLLEHEVLRSFARTLAAMHMKAVMLVHDRAELEAALAVETQFIAISNRHPETGAVDLGTTLSLAPQVPKPRSVISCFGIRTAADVARLQGHVDAVCIGTPLLRAADHAVFLRSLAAG